MRILLTGIALAATVVSFPALADPGCELGNPLNDTRASDCRNEPSGYVRMYAPTPWYDRGAYIGYGAYAYVPSRSYELRRGSRVEPVEGGATSLGQETELEGGSD